VDACVLCDIGLPPPGCVDGTCQFGGGGPQVDCDELGAQASEAVADAVDSADTSCATNEDCTSVDDSSRCFYGCGAIVSVTGAESVKATIDELDANLCAAFEEDGCMALAPPCAFPGDPQCVVGACVASLRPFGEPCSDACGNECYVPGPGGAGICSAQCTTDSDCGPTGICQSAGNAGKWCFRRCASDAECLSVNDDTENPLFCAERLDADDDYGFEPLVDAPEGFCIQSSEP
jgi:hypothetical protein